MKLLGDVNSADPDVTQFSARLVELTRNRERIGLVINDIPTVESKSPSQFGGVLLASARHAPLAPDKGYNTHDTLSPRC